MSKTKDLEYKYSHKWGFKDTEFTIENGQVIFKSGRYKILSNEALPNLISFVEEELLGEKLNIDDVLLEKDKKNIKPVVQNNAFINGIKKKLKSEQISTEDVDRFCHSHGQTTTEEVFKALYRGSLPRMVDLVLFPKKSSEVKDIILLANKTNVCLVPYGGGTSVSSALLLPKNEKRMIVSIDMRRMNQVIWLDKNNSLAKIQTGITGRELEAELSKSGYTMGHEPDSSEFSTLGGWISTNASGMKRNRYGNIEDIVQNFNLITPNGEIKQTDFNDRYSIGMQPKNFLFGSEGNLGIITEAVVRIHKSPEVKKFASVMFPDFDSGFKFLRALSKNRNFIPASVRLVDNRQFRFGYAIRPASKSKLESFMNQLKKFFLTKVKGFDPLKMSLLTLVMEGEEKEVLYQKEKTLALAKKFGGVSAGEKNGERGYMLTHLIAYIRDFLFKYHCIGETLETTAPWDKVKSICEKTEATLVKEHAKYKLPGKPFFSYRVTQLYHSSVCIYIMVALYGKGKKNPEDIYTKVEKALRKTIMENGGTVSHHHGVGKLRKEFMPKVLDKDSQKVAQAVKKSLDPKNIFGIKNNIFGN